MKLTTALCLTALLLSAVNAVPNPRAKPLSVKAQVGVKINSGQSQAAVSGMDTCAKEGEPCSGSDIRDIVCCQGLECETNLYYSDGNYYTCQPPLF